MAQSKLGFRGISKFSKVLLLAFSLSFFVIGHWLTLLLPVWEFTGLNLGLETC
jgi:hypothetical protein